MKNYQSRVKEAVDSQAVFQCMSDFILNVRRCWCLESVGRACIGLGYCWLVGWEVSQGVKGSVSSLGEKALRP